MSEEPDHDPTTIHASRAGGGAGKWLLGGLAAAIVLGGGYFAWQSMAPGPSNVETAYNDAYPEDSLRAAPLEPEQDTTAESALADESAPAPAPASPAPVRRPTARADAVPEATIGVTPARATMTSDDDGEIVVTAPRVVWTRMPSARRLSTYYPDRALELGREGEARLHCTVLEGGSLACERASESSSGFGLAAMRVARTLRHAPQRADGSDAVGTPLNLRVVFRIGDEEQRS